MPSATHFESPTLSSKKRRRDEDVELHLPLYAASAVCEISLVRYAWTDSAGFGSHSTSSPFNESQHLISAYNHNDRLVIPSNRGSNPHLGDTSRKVAPLPVSKKIRYAEDHDNYDQTQSQLHSRHQHHARSPGSFHETRPHDTYFSHAHPSPILSPVQEYHNQIRPSNSRANSSALLNPCHICHRKPTKKSDLDSFADCTGCGQRTCFVCIRACQGWLPPDAHPASLEDKNEDLSASFTMHDADDRPRDNERSMEGLQREKRREGGWSGRGHREVICSQCCVERGSEGDVVCLGCLAGVEGA
ncbi:hypothetical protein F5Y15DRAFT_20586 [Xylariaceae sp. FL0016]|nr:hypothetical protein F5Y15DRAFT_20586 [Xylariaceae sp. FL0016]